VETDVLGLHLDALNDVEISTVTQQLGMAA
jgi:hypothetical protein